MLFATVAGVALMLRFDLWHCPVAELVGVPCPGCGMSRAALALATGDMGRALALHPLSPLMLAWLVLVAAGGIARRLTTALANDLGARAELPAGRLRGGLPERAALVCAALGAVGRGVERATPLLLVMLVGVWIARFFGAFGGPVPVSSHLLG